jgi:hypothetical protein
LTQETRPPVIFRELSEIYWEKEKVVVLFLPLGSFDVFPLLINLCLCIFLQEDNDWGFIAMVLDRFFLWVFTAASLCGTISILFTAPALYDDSSPINLKYLDRLGFY